MTERRSSLFTDRFRFADDETEIRYASDGTLKQFPIHEQYALAGVVPHLLSYAAPYKCEPMVSCSLEVSMRVLTCATPSRRRYNRVRLRAVQADRFTPASLY